MEQAPGQSEMEVLSSQCGEDEIRKTKRGRRKMKEEEERRKIEERKGGGGVERRE